MQAELEANSPIPRTTAQPAVTIVAHDVGAVGGMERVLAELAVGLRGLGYAVTVIARTCELPAGTGVVFHRVRGPGRPFLLAYPWFVVMGSLALRRWRRGPVQATGAIVLNRVDVIAIHYCHQAGVVTPSRTNWLFRAHVKVTGILARLGERFCYLANTSTEFVCVSDGVAEEMREFYPQVSERVITIHNGVDTERFSPGAHAGAARALRERLQIPQGRLVAVFAGGEWERKGLRPAIEALSESREWDLVVAGGGDEKHYRELADSLGLGDAVHWLGEVQDMENVYEMADAFVLPSSYETFSLVTFEAAASGLAVLATPVNGVRELIEDRHNGFLITREPSVIAERLAQLAGDPALRIRLGRAARESALQFSWKAMVSAHDRLYSGLLDSAPGAECEP